MVVLRKLFVAGPKAGKVLICDCYLYSFRFHMEGRRIKRSL